MRVRRDLSGAGPGTRVHPPDPRPRWQRVLRRPALWAGGVVTAALVGILAGVGQQLLAPAVNRPAQHRSGAPVTMAALRFLPTPADSWAFPQRLDLTDAQLAFLSRTSNNQADPDAYGRWARDHGGAKLDELVFALVLQGNRDTPVRILDMRPVASCRAPADGTLLYNPSAGSEESVRIGFDLDQRLPVARTLTNGYGWGEPYFPGRTVSLRRGEQQTFEITAKASRRYCEFTLQLAILDAGRTVTQTIDSGGQPFRISGTITAGELGSPHFSAYRALYVGGVANPVDPGVFVRENPATFQ